MIYLASTSPRRRELFSMITEDFLSISPTLDEKQFSFLPPKELTYYLAKYKAYSVYNIDTNDCVITADTIVILKNKVLGKPADESDARKMLKELSGKKHVVLTSYCILYNNKEITKTVKTNVFFNDLTDEEIDDYISSQLWKGKAGAYGIQDKKFNLVNHYEGSYFNVVGFPIEEIQKDLRRLNLIH